MPVGEEEPITADARVIAATNKDLEDEISKGNFREDLFYRLNVIPFYVPPLRERKEDIAQLARHFLKEFSHTYNRRPREIADDALETLTRYTWPGNVRELRNVIERAVVISLGGRIEPHDFPDKVRECGGTYGRATSRLDVRQRELERATLVAALEACRGNQSQAARQLGISRFALIRMMDKHELKRPGRD